MADPQEPQNLSPAFTVAPQEGHLRAPAPRTAITAEPHLEQNLLPAFALAPQEEHL